MADNKLYYGDNIDTLRRYVKDETIDLVYLDRPFNSNTNHNVLFKDKSGQDSAAQIEAFGDTWQWDQASAATFHAVITSRSRAAEALVAFEKLLGHNDVLTYLSMMAARLVELRRVLKPSGSIYFAIRRPGADPRVGCQILQAGQVSAPNRWPGSAWHQRPDLSRPGAPNA